MKLEYRYLQESAKPPKKRKKITQEAVYGAIERQGIDPKKMLYKDRIELLECVDYESPIIEMANYHASYLKERNR